MPLTSYLATRRAEIEAQMAALKAELSEIEIAEAALGDARPAVVREGSIKDWALRALALCDEGADTGGVQAAIQNIGGPDVPRSSLTPQLSRLKAAGLLTQDGRNWRRVSTGVTPEAGVDNSRHGPALSVANA